MSLVMPVREAAVCGLLGRLVVGRKQRERAELQDVSGDWLETNAWKVGSDKEGY